ncbi:hypothetical protein LS48_03210 [Aequorivita aquimaris]|uniref:Cell wall anchor protein n=1 Tax=Aequorivita aquimaris TaxID=1548749 RepID=A0A137RJR9_9FLAO|nr:hypothetical protein [Aequorivita aquimaris]KXO00436.1 hypothetical protein LS48_03210 [Aequorivita aquimaris]
MKKSYTPSSLIGGIVLFVLLFSASAIQAQVGIGTTNPHASSALDITSTTQGLLLPRMTTAQRNILSATAANSLVVYDTDLKSFYYFDATALPAPGTWVKINAAANQRDNYKLVKSVSDFPTPSGGKITLDENTLYEINGLITLTDPIELNDAQLLGRDAGEDILFKATGNVFTGTTGGNIKNLTITGGGTVFAITGGTALLFQNCIVSGMASVGTISNVGLYFGNIVQFVGNTTGITYTSIGNLLLNNQAWPDSNNGTFETFTGTFGLIEKVSGFSSVNGSDVALDVSSNPTVGSGVLQGTVFSGTTSAPNGYIKKYTTGSYPGYSFTNSWTVNCPGIPRESDDVSSGNIYYNGTITTGFVQTVTNGNEFNLSGTSPNLNTTTAVNLFRVSSPQNNRLTYLGKKTRTFQINASLSVRGNSGTGDYYAFFIKKNGATGTSLVETNTLMRVNNTSDISSNSISGTVELAPNDYIEIWGQRLTGNGTTSITVFSLNVNLK